MRNLLVGICLLLCCTNVFAAERIISIGGTCTEILYALGKGASVVAVDITSTYPTSVESKKTLGFGKSINSEAIIALQPTMVVVSTQAVLPALVQQLQSAKINVVHIQQPTTSADISKAITTIGNATGKSAEAKKLLADLNTGIANAKKSAAKQTNKLKVLFVYVRGTKVMMVSGANTAVSEIIDLAGATNAITTPGQFTITSEAVIAANPDVILVTTHGMESVGGKHGVLGLPGIAQTKAGKGAKVYSMEDSLLLNCGPRYAQAAESLRALLYKAQQ